MKKVHLAVALAISILPFSAVLADDLVSLDDPAPAPAATAAPSANGGGESGGQSLESLDDTGSAAGLDDLSETSGDDGAVTLDVGDGDSFNPYTFSRNPLWVFLPIAALILVGFHLLPVPKRKTKRKIDQARRFFRGISGEGTRSAIGIPSKGEKK